MNPTARRLAFSIVLGLLVTPLAGFIGAVMLPRCAAHLADPGDLPALFAISAGPSPAEAMKTLLVMLSIPALTGAYFRVAGDVLHPADRCRALAAGDGVGVAGVSVHRLHRRRPDHLCAGPGAVDENQQQRSHRSLSSPPLRGRDLWQPLRPRDVALRPQTRRRCARDNGYIRGSPSQVIQESVGTTLSIACLLVESQLRSPFFKAGEILEI